MKVEISKEKEGISVDRDDFINYVESQKKEEAKTKTTEELQ